MPPTARKLSLIVLLLLAACAQGGAPPQTAAGASGRGGASPVSPEIERLVGPVSRDAKLTAYVQRVGRTLVERNGLSPGAFSFYVLDLPSANAHAVPSGQVFVTRGLLALLDDEAELAAAMAHEIGHVARRHSAERQRVRQGAIDAAVQAATTSGSVAVGQSVARVGLLALRRYSREQELEADRVGVDYLVKAGYRGSAMATLVEKLKRQSQLEARFFGETAEVAEGRSALSTHPQPDQRLSALQAMPVGSGGTSGREELLGAIDGMSVDDAPEEGFVRGSAFLHPTLRLAFEAPRDFRLFNGRDGVLAIGRDGALMYFTCAPEPPKGPVADWMRERVKPTPVDIQPTRIGGQDAAIGARARGADTGLAQVRYVMIRHEPGTCLFVLAADGPDRDRRIEALVAAARSYRPLSEAEAAVLRPYRLRVVPGDGASAAQLAARLPYADLRMERLLTLNGVDSPAELANRRPLKIVQP